MVRPTVAVVALGALSACASMPPERAAQRTVIAEAARECRRSFPVIERFEVGASDQLVYYYRPNVSPRDREAFLDCVRDRVAQKQGAASVASATGELRVPSDLRITAPAPGVPKDRAVFSGQWSGAWDESSSTAKHVLVVEEIGGTQATVLVGGIGTRGPIWSRHRATFADGALKVHTPQVLYLYRAQPDGSVLATMEFEGRIFRARLTRMRQRSGGPSAGARGTTPAGWTTPNERSRGPAAGPLRDDFLKSKAPE